MNISWELVYPLGAIVLFIAIAYGLWQHRTRNRANDKVTERATKALYDPPETYDAKKEQLKKKVR